MTSSSESIRRDVTIVNDLGLHARSAALLAKAAQAAAKNVWLEFGSERVDAKDVLDILSLGAAKGDRVTVIVEQAGDKQVIQNIITLFDNGFGE